MKTQKIYKSDYCEAENLAKKIIFYQRTGHTIESIFFRDEIRKYQIDVSINMIVG